MFEINILKQNNIPSVSHDIRPILHAALTADYCFYGHILHVVVNRVNFFFFFGEWVSSVSTSFMFETMG